MTHFCSFYPSQAGGTSAAERLEEEKKCISFLSQPCWGYLIREAWDLFNSGN